MSAYRAESVVRVDFTLEVEDFRRAGRDPEARRQLARIGLFLVVLVAACAGFVAATRGLAAGGLVGGGLALFLAWVARLTFRLDPAKRFGDRWEDIRHQKVEVTDEHFRVEDRTSHKRMTWDLVTHWAETEGYFLVYVDPGAYHLVPKRAFGSAEQATGFRQILADRVPAGGEARIATDRRGAIARLAFLFALLALLIGSLLEAAARIAL